MSSVELFRTDQRSQLRFGWSVIQFGLTQINDIRHKRRNTELSARNSGNRLDDPPVTTKATS